MLDSDKGQDWEKMVLMTTVAEPHQTVTALASIVPSAHTHHVLLPHRHRALSHVPEVTLIVSGEGDIGAQALPLPGGRINSRALEGCPKSQSGGHRQSSQQVAGMVGSGAIHRSLSPR